MTKYSKFGNLLGGYLYEKRLSQTWLAGSLGISKTSVNRWINDSERRPEYPETVICIADWLGLSRQQCEELLEAAQHSPYMAAYDLEQQEERLSNDKERLTDKKELTEEEAKSFEEIKQALNFIGRRLKDSADKKPSEASDALKQSSAEPSPSASDPTDVTPSTHQIVSQTAEVVQHLGQEVRYLRQDVNQPARDTPPDVYRQMVLHNVQTTWIDDHLRKTIHDAIYLQPGMTLTPEFLLRRPWNLELQSDKHAVPEDSSIYDLYIRHGRNLLILGKPASGKTVTLLQLTESLIEEAQTNDTYPVPIVLPLSSWGHDRLSLEDWLVEELLLKYQMAHNLTRKWLAQERIALLLDGLDEVSAEYREDCITAINDFKANYPIPLVVCSRAEDYHELQERLNLTGAVTIQPLTPSQIEDYLLEFGDRTEGIRVALAEDTELQKLVESPLMLYLMLLTYDGETPHDLLNVGSVQTLHQRLFQNYVARVFQLRPLLENHPYDQTQALGWLVNLAYGMQRHSQSDFFIERLQPSWFSTETEWQRYKSTIWLVVGLCVAIFTLIFFMIFLDTYEPWLRLCLSLMMSGMIGMYVFLSLKQNDRLGENNWLGITDNIVLQEELYWSHPSQDPFIVYIGRWLLTGLGGALVWGVGAGLFSLGVGLLIGAIG